MGDRKKQSPDKKAKRRAADDEKASWKILRVKRRIKAGYYDRPEVRDEILDLLLEAFMNGKR